MKRIFGRNNPEVDPKTAYRMESDRVMQAVTNPHTDALLDGLRQLNEAGRYLPPMYQEVGAEEHEPYCGPFDSLFQQTAFEGSYPDIFETLCKINDKVTFDDRN